MVLYFWIQVLSGLVIFSGIMIILWLIQRKIHNAGIVDVGWAAGIGILGFFYAITSNGYLPRRILVALLIATWSSRLAIYLWADRVFGRPEEGRHRALRAKWGSLADRKLFFFFQIQAFLGLFFSLPILILMYHPVPHWTGWDWAGLLTWTIGVGNTILADRQLARFRGRPESRGKTCRVGWWRYSRHPNYFFEWLHWWSYNNRRTLCSASAICRSAKNCAPKMCRMIPDLSIT